MSASRPNSRSKRRSAPKLPTMEPPVRERIIEALQLAASTEAQDAYAASVPLANVPVEVFCTWEDHYVPESPWFIRAFAAEEARRTRRV